MKEFIYLVLVIMLTPIYIIIKVFSTFMELMFEIVEPMAETMQKAIDNMAYFWKNVQLIGGNSPAFTTFLQKTYLRQAGKRGKKNPGLRISAGAPG